MKDSIYVTVDQARQFLDFVEFTGVMATLTSMANYMQHVPEDHIKDTTQGSVRDQKANLALWGTALSTELKNMKNAVALEADQRRLAELNRDVPAALRRSFDNAVKDHQLNRSLMGSIDAGHIAGPLVVFFSTFPHHWQWYSPEMANSIDCAVEILGIPPLPEFSKDDPAVVRTRIANEFLDSLLMRAPQVLRERAQRHAYLDMRALAPHAETPAEEATAPR